MRHLTMDELLALREPGAEPGTAGVQEHLAHCEACRGELERLHQRIARLRALPTLRPSRDRWPAVRARLAAERRQRRARLAGLAGLALAASAVLAVVGHDITTPAPVEASALAEVQERSRALEGALHDYDPDRRVLDGRTAHVAELLEDRIAELDRRLEVVELGEAREAREARLRDEQLLRLWRERVGLLDALVDVHVTRASNVGL